MKTSKLLEDLVVLDASTVLAGPSVGTFFAELGASVTKIEHPTYGDVTRTWRIPNEDKNTSVSAYFSSINYLKEYLQLDLSSPLGLDKFIKLVTKADILITNFKKGDAEKFGIEDSILRSLNPRLIIAKINGYGESSDRVAYDLILQAESGFMSMNGTPESGPVKMPVAMIDVLAAHHLKEAVLLALLERSKTDIGVSVSVSLYDAAVSSLVNQASNYLMANHIPKRIGSLHPNIAPYGELFKTKDGETITFAIGSNNHFSKLCDTLGISELISDPRFLDNPNRVSNREALFSLLNARCIVSESDFILGGLEKKNVPAGKVKGVDEVLQSSEASSLIREEWMEGVLTKRITSTVFTWK